MTRTAHARKSRAWLDASGVASKSHGTVRSALSKTSSAPDKTSSAPETAPAASDHVAPFAGAVADIKPVPAPVSGKPPSIASLSVRAQNVLKELTFELTGKTPPKGPWTPPLELVRQLTHQRLATARNCGRQTTAEIIRWAEAQGTAIRPLFYSGKSLSAMWQDAVTKFSSGEFTKMEIIQALERSTRRRNTQIPIALQLIILQILRSTCE
jgi:hypothetical protein